MCDNEVMWRLYLTCLLFLVLFPAQALSNDEWCKRDAPPEIKIVPIEKQTMFDNSLSFIQLSAKETDTINPYGHDSTSFTFGLAQREFSLDQSTSLKYLNRTDTNQGCLWYDKITVDVELNPKIYIAREYSPNSCQYKEVMRHEKEHLNVDRQVTNKYLRILGDYLLKAVDAEDKYGPYDLARQDEIAEKMQKRLADITRQVNVLMEKERAAKQAEVDSLGNYEKSGKYIREVCDKSHPETATARDHMLRAYLLSRKPR
ncbi:MAG: hypothetical protein CMH28_10570 [Micavibrio sp.]|nr:hypothetical protein [Micavibrio sp.]|tara:strand:+ start:681 stop:1457 length:777 start_codon:yes stop_codon:yes gene_type:complete